MKIDPGSRIFRSGSVSASIGAIPVGSGETVDLKLAYALEAALTSMSARSGCQNGIIPLSVRLKPAPVGSRHRQQLNGEFVAALLRDFRHGGPAAIAKVRKNQPAAYCKLLTLLCPRDVKVEHSGGVKAMTDEQLEAAIDALQRMIAAREAGAGAKVIEGTAETVALPAPDVVADGPNNDMDATDTAVGAQSSRTAFGRIRGRLQSFGDHVLIRW